MSEPTIEHIHRAGAPGRDYVQFDCDPQTDGGVYVELGAHDESGNRTLGFTLPESSARVLWRVLVNHFARRK